MRTHFDGHRFGKALDSMLGRAIDRPVNAAHHRHLARDGNNRPLAAIGNHRFRHCLRREIGPAKIHIHHRVEIGGIGVDGRRVTGKAGAVDEDVQRAQRFDRRGHGIDVRDVTDHHLDGLARGGHRRRHLVKLIPAPCHDDDMRAGFGQRHRTAKANTG